jgi:hypothetical protein
LGREGEGEERRRIGGRDGNEYRRGGRGERVGGEGRGWGEESIVYNIIMYNSIICQTYTPQPSTPIKHAGSDYS